MRAQSQRKAIWMLNVALGVGVVAVIAWILVRVRPAVADTAYLHPKFADAAEKTFLDQPPPPGGLSLGRQVDQKELAEIDRPEFKTKAGRRFHWLYSGPMPPPPPEDPKPDVHKAPVQDDLSQLGKVVMLMYDPPAKGEKVASGTVVCFDFKSGTRAFFSPGEFMKEPKSKTPGSIKLVNVTPKPGRARVYELEYDVYGDHDAPPIKTDTYTYDGTIELPPSVANRIRPVMPDGSEVPGSTGTEGAGPASGGATASAPGKSGVTVVGSGTGAAPAETNLQDLKPEVQWDDARQTANVRFDQSTYDYFQHGDAETLANSVTTQTATDPDTGKTLGLRITGISAQTPAERFDVKPGDILVSINDRPVQTRSDALNIAQSLPPDTKLVKVVIDRRGRRITFNIDPTDPKTRRAARPLQTASGH